MSSGSSRIRADRLLVDRGLFDSRAKAQAAIAAGLVTADGRPVGKPSDLIAPDAAIVATPAHPYVSRGGVKLAAALDRFGVDPRDRICVDVGASTGGFSQVLLERGARHVYAVDVGTAQLHDSLRGRPDLTVLEQTDIRRLDGNTLSAPPNLIVIDVSFIPLGLVLPAALALARAPADLVALIKPQFEAGRAQLKKGIVRDPVVRQNVCDTVAAQVAALGWSVVGAMPSPIEGGDGNHEFLLAAHRQN
jgi:23S rRNA (cytidine1920-2'-O)/16S rRNA (cytidine1409-2'-O)-methyltransferase